MPQNNALGTEGATIQLTGEFISRDGRAEIVVATDVIKPDSLQYWLPHRPESRCHMLRSVWESELTRGTWKPAIPPEMQVDEGL